MSCGHDKLVSTEITSLMPYMGIFDEFKATIANLVCEPLTHCMSLTDVVNRVCLNPKGLG